MYREGSLITKKERVRKKKKKEFSCKHGRRVVELPVARISTC